jgi:hypothetical protein
MLPTWSQYHRENKDSMSMNEMIRQYNFMMDLEYMADTSTSESEVVEPTNFLLQENSDYLLQENGDRIIL